MQMKTETGHSSPNDTVQVFAARKVLTMSAQQPEATHVAVQNGKILAVGNAADMAARLNLSPRTLHRQLKDEGASLQNLKNTVRRELATDLLQRSQRPIKQVALAAGFQNEKSFIRAFKGWTGMTPGEWRNAGGGGRA